DGAARFEGHVDVDPEVLAVEHDRRCETSDLAVSHTGIRTVELEVQADRLGHTLEREIAVEHEVVAVGPHTGRDEGCRRVLLRVEIVGRLHMSVTLLVAGVDGIDRDLRGDRRRAVLAHYDGAGERVEMAAHLADNQVAYREGDRRVNWI